VPIGNLRDALPNASFIGFTVMLDASSLGVEY